MALKFLPPGFRFHPTDLELILYYLKRKIMGKKLHYEAIAEVNIYKFSPWDLPDKSSLKSKDLEWFFFCPREKKYASGSRVKRATENGYWKTTGKDRIICYNKQTVGTVKTLVFHLGHAPQGERTDWVLYEYRIVDEKLADAGLQDTYVLCKVFKKDGVGPRNGAQYGAPFNEADWADDGDAENQAISFASDSPQMTMQMQTEEETLVRGLNFSVGDTSGSRLVAQGPPPSAGGTANEIVATETDDNDIVHLLASFTDEDMLLSNDNGVNQGGLVGDIVNAPLSCSDGHDIYNGLGDLDNWGLRNEGTLDFSLLQNDVYYLNHTPFQDNSAYIELDDLLPPLDCSNGVTTTDQFSNNEIYGEPSHENVQQLYSGAPFSGKGLYGPCSNGLSAPHGESYQVNGSSHQFQMFDHQIYQGSNALSGLHFTSGKTRNMGHPSYNMERASIGGCIKPLIILVGAAGSQKLDCFSRLMECNPAHQIPTAALAYSSPYIGSSIHIKAEVTHRAGECTNEALTVMMGGSGSCWCFWQDIRKLQSLLVMIYPLPCLVEFRFDLICFLSGTIRWSHYFCFYYNCCHLHLNEDSVIIFSSTIIIGNLIDSFVNIIKSFKHFPKFNNLSV